MKMNYFTVNCKVSLRASSSVNHSSPQQAAGYSGSRIKNKGFTLVELLVVIAIIAILATIGVTVFSGAQGSARDGKRTSEINSIAKAIESSKDYEKGTYKYDSNDADKDFPKGFPEDPKSDGTASTVRYCIKASTGTTPPAVPGGWYGKNCYDSTWKTVSNSFNGVGTAPYLNDGTIKSWTICASLERSTDRPACQQSLTK